jgi:hypothetical protein
MSILNHSLAVAAYEDSSVSNNPTQRSVDWRKSTGPITVTKPSTVQVVIPPASSVVVFSGTRSTSMDGTTVFASTLNPVLSSTYRLTRTSGTAPAFRTDRALTLSGATVTVAINNNATATFSSSVGGSFSSVSVGDNVFIPTAATGDSASPFNTSNGGLWVVLAQTATVLTMARSAGESFGGVAEVVVVTANSQFLAFTSSGVQVNDTLEIVAGFSVVAQKAFTVSRVTPSWVEFVSTEALPLESAITPGVGGLVFYTNAKTYVRVESDQEVAVRLNGDSGNTNRLSPRASGTKGSEGWMDKWGPTWSLELVNRSRSSSANVTVISAE